MQKNLWAKAAVLVLAVCMLGACSKTNAVENGEAAMDFQLTDIEGKTVNLSDFKGKAIILNFFASWCPPCRMEIPDFIDLQKQYGDKGFTMIGVSLVDAQDSKSFASRMGINYPVLVDDGKVSMLYGPIRSIPTTFIIDKNFKIVKKYIGLRSREEFEADVQELVK